MSEDNAVSTEAEEREPGSTYTSAHELGDITAQRLPGGLRKLAQTVGTEGDAVDYYRFTLSEAREVRLGLKLRQGEAELYLEDAEGNVLARSMAHAGYEAAVRTLLPGTYYVRVEAVGAAASEYEFRYGVLEANASFRPASDSPWHTGEAERMGMPSFGEAGYGFELSETVDGSVSGVLLGTVLAVDPNGEELSYRIVGGNGSELFALGGASGELSYVGAGEDFEGGVTSYELTVRASDGTHTIDTTVTVTVTDAAEAPAFGDGSYAFELAENADGRINRISLGTVTATDPDSDTVRYSLLDGNDSSLFAIEETSGELFYVGAGEDFEGGVTSYELTIRASDGTHTIDTTVTVTVTDAAEQPAFGDGSYAFELAENADGRADGLSLGRVLATDPDGDEVRYSLTGGNESMLFNIDETSGELYYVGPGEDYESGVTSYEVTVRASDAAHTVDTTVTVTVTDAAEAPAFGKESYAFELAENVDGRVNRLSLGTVTATDPDSDTVRYSLLGGNDSSLFAIEETSGELFYVGAGEDFEGGVTSYELTIRASDETHTIDTTVTVTVTDAAEQPAFGDGRYAFELAENADGRANGLSLGRVLATDPDGDEVRYSLAGGNELFTVDETSGELYYVGPGEDYESGVTSYEVTVRASDAAHTVDTTVTVTVTDAAEAPAFAEESYAFELAENVDGRVNRLSLGSVTATDPDSDTVRYSLLVGNDSSLFGIEETSGELFYVGAGEDFEGGVTSYELTVRASDGTHTIDTTVTVTVTDAAEQPAFGDGSYAFELAENADGRANGLSLGRVTATDPDGDEVRYSLTGGNVLFNIDETSGELYYVGPGEDYESGVTSYEVTVRASDAAHTVDTTVTVTVTDKGEAPAFGEESYAFELAENVDGRVNRLSLGTVTATDPDSDGVRYSLVGGNDSDLFAIGETSGELYYVGPGEDYEGGVTSYELTVRASDGTHASDAAVTVALGDVRGRSEPEGGDLPNDRTTTGMVLVDEGAVTGNIEMWWDLDWFAVELVAGRTYRIDFRGQPTGDGTLVDPFLYGVFDGDGRLIPGTTIPDGGTSHNSRLVFTAPGEGTYYIATSGNGTYPSGTGTYELEVRDVRAPVFAEAGYRFALSENADGSASRIALGAVEAADPDGATVRYSLVGGNESRRFAIDADTGEVFYVGSGEDYESGVTSHALKVQASDGAYSTQVTVTVAVTDAPEAPVFAEESYAFALAENADGSVNRQLLGAATATDPDGATVRYSLSGGNEPGLFAIDEASGELFYVGSGEDYEDDAGPYELTVQASDGTHAVYTMVTVTVAKLQFDPEKVADPQGSSEPPGEDLPAGRATSGEVRVDAEPVEGTLRSPSDRDWFAVTLAPGRTYAFNLEGDTPRDGTGTAPEVRGLRDANGDPVPDILGGEEVRYTTDAAAANAQYYIEVGGGGDSGQGSSATRGFGTRSSVATVGSVVNTRGNSDGGSDYRLWASDITETRDVTDDYRSGVMTTGEVAVGGSVTGEIERAGDRDWFAVTLEGGRLYRIDLEGSETGAGTLFNSYLRGVHDANGNRISGTTNDNSGVGFNSRVYFMASEEDATYYVATGGYRGSEGTYTLSVRDVTDGVTDDFAAGTGTSGTVEVGGSATGKIDYEGDRDWFAVTLEAGTSYRIDLESHWIGARTLRNPYLRGVHDANGNRISGTTNDDGGWLLDSRVLFTAPEDATYSTYYVAAGGYGGSEGTYTLSVRDVTDGVTDDFAAGTGTSGTVEVGGSATGKIDYEGDRDWFAVTLVAGRTYWIDLEGSRTGAGTLRDPYLRGVHDANGNRISGTTTDDAGVGVNSWVYFTASEDVTYYVATGGYGRSEGTYTLLVRDVTDGVPGDFAADTSTTGALEVRESITGEINILGDRDWFAVALEADKTYRIDLEGSRTGAGTLRDPYLHGVHDANGNRISGTTDDDGGAGDNSRVFFTAPASTTYYVAAGGNGQSQGTYTLSVRELPDDFAAGTGTTGTVMVGGTATGKVEFFGDTDWFAVALAAGTTYRIELEGSETGAGTLPFPYLHGVHDGDGNLIDGTTDFGGGAGWNSRVYFTAAESTTYYVAASGFLEGTYKLLVRDTADDFAAETGTSGTVEVGGTATGEIDYEGDRDWFAVTLVAGRTYWVDLKGSETGAGTLRDPYLRGIHDANGVLLDYTANNNNGAGWNSRVYFKAMEADTYYVAAGARGNDIGTYTLSVRDVTDGPPDDYEDDTSTTGSLTVGGTATGEIEPSGDRDWFAVTLAAGTTYRIDLEGWDTGAGTLRNPFLRGVHDAEGNLINGTTNYNSGAGHNSRVYFTASEADTYYVAAGAFRYLEGTYTLSVEEVTDGM